MGSFGATEGSRTSVSGTASSLVGSSGFVNDQRPGEKNLLLQEEVSALLQKNILEEVSLLLGWGFYSRLFLVTKKNGQMRPVLDLSILNQYLVVPHFKMGTNTSIRT
jgi:hypothetical protein